MQHFVLQNVHQNFEISHRLEHVCLMTSPSETEDKFVNFVSVQKPSTEGNNRQIGQAKYKQNVYFACNLAKTS